MNKQDLILMFEKYSNFERLTQDNFNPELPVYTVLIFQDYEIMNLSRNLMLKNNLFIKKTKKEISIIDESLNSYLFREHNALATKISNIVKKKYKITETINRKLFFKYFDIELENFKSKQKIKIEKDCLKEYAGYTLEDKQIILDNETYASRRRKINNFLKDKTNYDNTLKLISKNKNVTYYERIYKPEFGENLSKFLELSSWIVLTFQINDGKILIDKLSNYNISKYERKDSIDLIKLVYNFPVKCLVIDIDKAGNITEFKADYPILYNHYKFEPSDFKQVKFINKMEDLAWDLFLEKAKS